MSYESSHQSLCAVAAFFAVIVLGLSAANGNTASAIASGSVLVVCAIRDQTMEIRKK